MKLLYKPLGIVLGLLAGWLGREAFQRVWALIDQEAPPKPTTEDAGWAKALTAAALQAAIFAVVRAAVDRAGATWFRDFTGVWPGPKHQEAAEDA
ncbi:MAG: DUF4235 domain-containing protein [Solirubrobacteraceae bacterium]|nr:DUF4235 domain-containing protein [Solirubrobacteraceae bacterium]